MGKINKLSLATLKVVSKQYMSVEDLSESVTSLYSEFEQEIIQILNDVVTQKQEPSAANAGGSNVSEEEKATNIGSKVPVRAPALIGSAPKIIKCLFVSEVKTLIHLVGTKFAPVIVLNSTALVFVPEDSSHLKIPPPLTPITKSSP